MSFDNIWLWVVFNLFVLGLLALDLGLFHRDNHVISAKEALVWSAVWIALALAFNAGVYFFSGAETALQFFTGYLIEKSLSVDNIFVFILIFSFFSVPAKYQYKVLFWGIISALLMRGVLIAVGATLIKEFHFIIYIFGAFLILTGIRMALHKGGEIHPERNPLVRLFKRIMPTTDRYHGANFFVKENGIRYATPLFIALLVVESTDLLFAVDSIPAIFAVTDNPFIVYTSNVFAILGLRSLYFALSGLMDRFHYLKAGLAAVLVFVGAKMLLTDVYKMPVLLSLGVIAGILLMSVVASLVRPRSEVAVS